MRVKFKRLLDCLHYDQNTEFTFYTPNYNGEAHMVAADVLQAIKTGVQEQKEYFGRNNNLNENVEATRQYHLGRVIYFINCPVEIANIEVKSAWWMKDNKVCSHAHLQIEDGYHRVLAGICLGFTDEEVEIKNFDYIRDDVLNYLKGKTNDVPTGTKELTITDSI